MIWLVDCAEKAAAEKAAAERAASDFEFQLRLAIRAHLALADTSLDKTAADELIAGWMRTLDKFDLRGPPGAHLVISAPGWSQAERFGHGRLAGCLRRHISDADAARVVQVQICVSSTGRLIKSELDAILAALAHGTAAGRRALAEHSGASTATLAAELAGAVRGSVHVLWPTAEHARWLDAKTRNGLGLGQDARTAVLSSMNIGDEAHGALREMLCLFEPRAARRDAMNHCKVWLGLDAHGDIVWMLVGSHNLSGAALGQMITDDGRLLILNHEASVLLTGPALGSIALPFDPAAAPVPYGCDDVPYSMAMLAHTELGTGPIAKPALRCIASARERLERGEEGGGAQPSMLLSVPFGVLGALRWRQLELGREPLELLDPPADRSVGAAREAVGLPRTGPRKRKAPGTARIDDSLAAGAAGGALEGGGAGAGPGGGGGGGTRMLAPNTAHPSLPLSSGLQWPLLVDAASGKVCADACVDAVGRLQPALQPEGANVPVFVLALLLPGAGAATDEAEAATRELWAALNHKSAEQVRPLFGGVWAADCGQAHGNAALVKLCGQGAELPALVAMAKSQAVVLAKGAHALRSCVADLGAQLAAAHAALLRKLDASDRRAVQEERKARARCEAARAAGAALHAGAGYALVVLEVQGALVQSGRKTAFLPREGKTTAFLAGLLGLWRELHGRAELAPGGRAPERRVALTFSLGWLTPEESTGLLGKAVERLAQLLELESERVLERVAGLYVPGEPTYHEGLPPSSMCFCESLLAALEGTPELRRAGSSRVLVIGELNENVERAVAAARSHPCVQGRGIELEYASLEYLLENGTAGGAGRGAAAPPNFPPNFPADAPRRFPADAPRIDA